MECDNELHGKMNSTVQGHSKEQHTCLRFSSSPLHLVSSLSLDFIITMSRAFKVPISKKFMTFIQGKNTNVQPSPSTNQKE